MVTIKQKTTVKQRISAKCPSHSRADVSVRDVSFTIDEPVERDGTNMGPTPTETALGALAACTNVIGNKVAHKLGLDVSNFEVSIVSDFDRRGVTLAEEVDVPFEAIKLRVELSTTASQGEIDQLAVEVAKYCPLAKLFRQAGTRLDAQQNWHQLQIATGYGLEAKRKGPTYVVPCRSVVLCKLLNGSCPNRQARTRP